MRRLQLILLGAIVLVLVLLVGRLYLWERGIGQRRAAEEEEVPAENFDVEVLDQVYGLTAEQLAGKREDGKNTILCLGNDSLAWDYENGLAKALGEATGAEIRNAGFPGSAITVQGGRLDTAAHPEDIFSFYHVAECIHSGDFSDLEEAARARWEENYFFQTATETLRDTDYGALDTILICYDAEDYFRQRSAYNPDEGKTWTDLGTVAGAAASGIRLIREAYPHIRLILVTPALALTYTPEGEPIAADRYDYGHGTLTTYVEFTFAVGEACGVTVLDNYHGMAEEDNANGYLVDARHLSVAGNAALAAHIARVL